MSSGAVTTQIPRAAADTLRQQLRVVAEEEYLRLRTIDRPALLLRGVAGAEAGEDPDVTTAELEVVDERIAALDHFLHRTSTDLTSAGRVLLVDRGDGPEYLLVSELPVVDERVVAADAPLGKALCDAVAGQTVTYVTPSGSCEAYVIATEPIEPGPALPAGAYGVPAAEVLVGFDGSPSSRTAVAWAAKEAALRARPLRVLHARASAEPSGRADGTLSEGIQLALTDLGADRIRATAVTGQPAPRLAERADRAELVVVGRGGETDNGLGPVAEKVLSGTSRTTVVVPPAEPPARGRVVVGLHDSWHAADALSVGFAEAHRRGAHLLVTVIRDVARGTHDLEPAFHAPDEQDHAEALHLPAAVAEVGQAYPGVQVRTSVQTGHFSTVLTELSNSADLVVLGMGGRAHGMGRKELLVASHARCPVIVVRESSGRGEF